MDKISLLNSPKLSEEPASDAIELCSFISHRFELNLVPKTPDGKHDKREENKLAQSNAKENLTC